MDGLTVPPSGECSALQADEFWRNFIAARPALLGRDRKPADDGLTIPPVPPARPSKIRPRLPARLVLVGVANPDRPFRLRHTIVYVDQKHLRAIEREWRLVATAVEGGDGVEGVYLLTGRAA